MQRTCSATCWTTPTTCGGSSSARKKLVRDLQMNPTTVSVVLGYLKELGLVEVNGRYAENGAQLENGYTVTEAGCEFVAESPKARR